MKSIPAFSQRDPRWKDKKLGRSQETIGEYGCLLVDLVMIANYYGFQETPISLNKKMRQAGGFQGAYLIPRVIANVLPGVRQTKYRKVGSDPAPLAEIDAALAQGHPVIVEVDYSPKAGIQNHWVVLYQKAGADYLIRDPWPYPPAEHQVHLLSRYGFAGNAARLIRSVLWMEGPLQGTPPVEEPPADVVASFPLFATVDDLALRSSPAVSPQTLIRRVARNTRFDVLTSDADAGSKVGLVGAWLPVRTPDGQRGYVAAWYLSREEQPVAPPPEEPPAGEVVASFPVFTAVDDLALRTRPLVSPETLIRRLPRNTRCEVLTNDEEAYRKIGAAGAWLPVRTPDGQRGFVAAWYLNRQPQQPPPPAPPAAGSLQVRTTVNNLSFRSQPRILPETLIGRLPFHTALVVLEEPAQAQPKIGALNQWLHVQTESGQRGYVAAWYVERMPPAAAPPPAPAPQDTLTVYVTADNLALRSLPYVSAETLRKRLPLGAPLLVLENAERARQKIGKNGQWLLVRDAAGTEGYVAAWYVR